MAKITVTSAGNKATVTATSDTAMYYSNKSREWAISDKIIDNEDYSSKYYANESKKQAETVKNKITEVNNAVAEGITNIINQENISVDNVNTAGATQVNLAKKQATIASEQAGIATAKTSEVVESGNTALSSIGTAKTGAMTDITDLKNTSISNITTAKNNAITSITNQETTSKTSLIDEGATQIGLIQNEGATQVANVQSTGFYMRDDKLYFINSQGEETEFKSGDAGRIEEQLAGKVDVSNTQWATNAGMPDYSAAVSKSINVNYIEATNGFLVVDYINTSASSHFEITIKGTSFNFSQEYIGTDYSHCNVGFVPIPKNTTYKITTAVNTRVRYFPCIGG